MAPKREANKLPAPVETLRVALGGNVTIDGLNNADASTRTRAFSAMSGVLGKTFPSKHAEYKSLQHDIQRREWLLSFIVDPASGGCSCSNTTLRANTEKRQLIKRWLTESQLAGAMYYNSAKDAALAIKDLESRAHEKPTMAAAGILQYHEDITQFLSEQEQREEAKISVTAELDADQYAMALAHMAGGSVDPPKRAAASVAAPARTPKVPRKADIELKVLTPDEKVKEKATDKYEKIKKEAKVLHGKMTRELGEVHLVEKKLSENAFKWGAQPLAYLKEQTDEQSKAAKSLLELWDTDSGVMSVEELNGAATTLEAFHLATKAAYIKYVKEVLKEFARK
jgi:hypothetical protein